jgi:hypothetical protein
MQKMRLLDQIFSRMGECAERATDVERYTWTRQPDTGIQTPGRSNKDSEETSASPESSDVFPIYLPRTTTYMGGGKDSFQKPIDPLGMQCFRLRASP